MGWMTGFRASGLGSALSDCGLSISRLAAEWQWTPLLVVVLVVPLLVRMGVWNLSLL